MRVLLRTLFYGFFSGVFSRACNSSAYLFAFFFSAFWLLKFFFGADFVFVDIKVNIDFFFFAGLADAIIAVEGYSETMGYRLKVALSLDLIFFLSFSIVFKGFWSIYNLGAPSVFFVLVFAATVFETGIALIMSTGPFGAL